MVLATGSIPKPLLGLKFGGRVLTRRPRGLLDELPGSMAVIGAGASGTEIASAFGRLGTQVALLEALPQILPLEDEEIAKAAAREIGKQNVEIVTGANIEGAEAKDDGVELTFGGDTKKYDYLVIAAGRGAGRGGTGLDEAGVKTSENGLVEVDGRMRTSLAGVYAIGDIVPVGPALAHKASDEGIIAVEDAAGLETHALDYPHIPAATFCYPQVASFGLTEKQARDAGHDVVVGKVPMGAVGRRHRVRRPRRDGQARRRQAVRRAARRAHRRREGRRHDPGAGCGARPRGRLPRGGTQRARASDVLRGRHGGRARGRRLAHSRLAPV